MTSFSQKFSEKIRQDNLRPEPRWHFRLEKFLSVLVLASSMFSGAVSVGLVIELVKDLRLVDFLDDANGLDIIFSNLPYFWIAIIILTLSSSIVDFVKTMYGYRYQLKYITGIFLAAIISTGIFSHAYGFSHNIEEYMERSIPIYSKIIVTPREFQLEREGADSSSVFQPIEVIETDVEVKEEEGVEQKNEDGDGEEEDDVREKNIPAQAGQVKGAQDVKKQSVEKPEKKPSKKSNDKSSKSKKRSSSKKKSSAPVTPVTPVVPPAVVPPPEVVTDLEIPDPPVEPPPVIIPEPVPDEEPEYPNLFL